MNIGWIEISKRKYGGIVYNQEAREALARKFTVDVIVCEPKYFSPFRYLRIPESLFHLTFLKGKRDLWVRDFYSTLTIPFDKTSGKNLVVIHHDDFSGFPLLTRPFFKIAQRFFYSNLHKMDAIVTVSDYWKKYFLEKGYKNVYKIYNGFNIKDFDISEEAVGEFKERYHLLDKPIIYIGNCQRAKGVVEAYHALKDLDVYLVTSGKKRVDIPALNLDLEYADYLKLLKASYAVIAMSRFREGWCRTAHEAMLCKTPVIGSGLGGMRELLEGGRQTVCKDFKNLKKEVEYLLKGGSERDQRGLDGYNFAKDFTIEKFNENWLNLITGLL